MTRRRPDQTIALWLRGVKKTNSAVTAVTVFELYYGRNLLPHSERRRALDSFIDGIVEEGAFGRLLSFGPDTAEHAAAFNATRRRMGRPVNISDCLIAGHVLEHGATLATRNIRDFDGVGLSLVNPWEIAS